MTEQLNQVREVSVHYTGRSHSARSPFRAPADIYRYMANRIGGEAREHFVAVYLDARHRPIADQIVSVGTATASLIHPREIFQAAVLVGACALVVAHNHPSGDPTPSDEDRSVTKRLAEAGKLIGIKLLDHVIIAVPGGFTSMNELGELPK